MSAHTPGYEITTNGCVFSLSSNWRGYGKREMEQTPNHDGYPSVRIIIDGVRKRIAVHRLVAAKYLPPRPSANHQIRHLDGDKQNSHFSNLAWGTAKENADDRERHGKTSRGDKHSSAIRLAKPGSFSDAERLSIVRLNAKGWSQRAIAARFGASPSGIGNVIRRSAKATGAA